MTFQRERNEPREEKETVQGYTAGSDTDSELLRSCPLADSVLTLERNQRVTHGVRSPLEEGPRIRWLTAILRFVLWGRLTGAGVPGRVTRGHSPGK